MRRDLIYSGQRFVVALLLALSLSSSGCSDSVSVSEDVRVPLASLVITPGTLQPGFFSNTTSYKVNAPTSANSVTVTATPRNSAVEVTINGLVTAAGQGRSISLGTPGSITTITIVLFSQTTGSETTYTINVTRLLSSDDTLKDLTVSPGTLNPNPFNADTLEYKVDVGNTVGEVTVTANKSDKDATMVIRSPARSVTVGPTVNPGQLPVTLGGPGTSTPVTLEVTAPNGSKKTYQITINQLSGDNNLKALSISPGALPPPGFDPNTLNYTVDVASDVDKVTVSATKSDPNAVITGSVTAGAGIETATETLHLKGQGEDTDIFIIVTATDQNVALKPYKIKVRRAMPSSNKDLKDLAVVVTAGDPNLINNFDKNTTNYTVNVASIVQEVIVSATKDDPTATMLIGSQTFPAGIESGQETFPLNGAGGEPKRISIEVTAQSGGIPKIYIVDVVRAAPAVPPAPASVPDLTATSDDGSFNDDDITSITTPSFMVSAPAAGETASLYINGIKVQDATFDSSTNTFTLTTPLTGGDHTITSRVTNTATTLESLDSPALSVTITTTPP